MADYLEKLCQFQTDLEESCIDINITDVNNESFVNASNKSLLEEAELDSISNRNSTASPEDHLNLLRFQQEKKIV